LTGKPEAPFPIIGVSEVAVGVPQRIGQVMVVAIVIAAWMGLAEGLVVCVLGRVPEPMVFGREVVLGYAAFGAVVGAVWAGLVEPVSRRRGRWRRTPFYLVSLVLWILLFQVVVHTHLHWTGGSPSLINAGTLKVTAIEALPVLLIIGVVWRACLVARRPAGTPPIMSLRTAGILGVPLVLVAVLPWVVAVLTPARRADVPNVLLIVLDTTRVDRLSAFGYERPTTPALERIAADGLVFGRAYAAAPWTLPSHASMFTGAYPAVHNATWEHQVLDDRLPTLAESLAGHGLRTAAFARQVWLSEETGLMRGFEDFYDLHWRASTSLVAVWRLAAEIISERLHTKDKGAALVTAKFKAWLDRHGDEPFFAFVNYLEPHAYYEPPAGFRERFLSDNNRGTPWGRTRSVSVQRYNSGDIEYGSDDLAAFSDLYDGAVAYQDSRMGEVLDHLRDRGLLDKTLVIITADHGENLGDHGLLGHEFCVYETLLHVPLVVRLPGSVPVGRVESEVVENRLLGSLIDTVLWADEGTLSVEMLVAALQEPDAAGAGAFAELYTRPLTTDLWLKSPRLDEFDRRLRSILLRGMKYIFASDGTDELYDLATDPDELDNLAEVRPEDLAVLRDLVQARVAGLGVPAGGDAPEFSEQLKRRLKALGYLD